MDEKKNRKEITEVFTVYLELVLRPRGERKAES
jgi:hypothetical protein